MHATLIVPPIAVCRRVVTRPPSKAQLRHAEPGACAQHRIALPPEAQPSRLSATCAASGGESADAELVALRAILGDGGVDEDEDLHVISRDQFERACRLHSGTDLNRCQTSTEIRYDDVLNPIGEVGEGEVGPPTKRVQCSFSSWRMRRSCAEASTRCGPEC